MERSKHNECYNCWYMETIPGDAHIKCNNPPDRMPGHSHGVKNGWFNFPYNYDVTWKLELCPNYEPTKGTA